MSGAFRVECTGPAERPLRVVVHGDLDYAHHGELEAALAELAGSLHAGEDLVVDVAGVTYCDSCGLRALLWGSQRVEARGARFVLRGVGGRLGRALRLTGLDAVLGGADDAGVDAARSEGPAVQS